MNQQNENFPFFGNGLNEVWSIEISGLIRSMFRYQQCFDSKDRISRIAFDNIAITPSIMWEALVFSINNLSVLFDCTGYTRGPLFFNNNIVVREVSQRTPACYNYCNFHVYTAFIFMSKRLPLKGLNLIFLRGICV